VLVAGLSDAFLKGNQLRLDGTQVDLLLAQGGADVARDVEIEIMLDIHRSTQLISDGPEVFPS
jgi:hypothetical protein